MMLAPASRREEGTQQELLASGGDGQRAHTTHTRVQGAARTNNTTHQKKQNKRQKQKSGVASHHQGARGEGRTKIGLVWSGRVNKGRLCGLGRRTANGRRRGCLFLPEGAGVFEGAETYQHCCRRVCRHQLLLLSSSSSCCCWSFSRVLFVVGLFSS